MPYDEFDMDNFLTEFDNVEVAGPTLDEALVPEGLLPASEFLEIYIDGSVETAYKSQPQVFEAGENVLATRAYVAELQAGIVEADTEVTALKKKLVEMEREYMASVAGIRARRDELNTLIARANREIRAAQEHVRLAENKFRQALQALRATEAFMANALAFDDITATMPWREFAFDYQIDGAKFLAAAGSAIEADKMGLGKSLISLMALDMLKVQRACIIVPDDVVANFANEIKRWAPHRTIILLGKQEKSMRTLIFNMLPNMEEFILLGNYSMWRKDKSIPDEIVRARVEAVILDEAHTIKRVSTSAFKGCKKIVLSENSCPNCGKFVQRVKMHEDWLKDFDHYGDLTIEKFWDFKQMNKEFYVCSGIIPPQDSAQSRATTIRSGHCGWSQLADYTVDITREYGAMRSVKHVFPMTGTPILNSPMDLFPLLHLMDDKVYPDAKSYEQMYCERWGNKVVFKYGGMERIVKQLSGRYISRTKEEVGLKIPPQSIIVHTLDFDEVAYPAQTKVIKDLSQHAALMYGDRVIPVLEMIALITRKRQANVLPAGIVFKNSDGDVIFSVGDECRESIKLDAIVAESSDGEFEGLGWDLTGGGDRINGERVVVFSQFKTALAELERRFRRAGIDVVRFDGDTPDSVRDECKVDFDRRARSERGGDFKWQVILCNYKTGGQGLNFTDATQMIVLDAEWNPGKEEQAFARTARLGQTEETTVHILEIEKTIDAWMRALIEDKREMIDGFEDNAKTAMSLLDAIKKGEIY